MEKILLLQEMVGERGGRAQAQPPPRPFMDPFLYGPDQGLDQEVINSIINIIIQ